MTTFREAALAAWEQSHGDTEAQARAAIVALLGEFDVAFERVAILPTQSGVTVVFADADGVHLAGVKRGDAAWRVHLVRPNGSEWGEVGPPVTSLAQLHDLVLTLPPTEPAGPPEFKAGEQVTSGPPADRRTWKGKVYEVLQPHTTAAHWAPDVATSLWAEVVD